MNTTELDRETVYMRAINDARCILIRAAKKEGVAPKVRLALATCSQEIAGLIAAKGE